MNQIVNFEKYESPYDGLKENVSHTTLIGDSVGSSYVPFIMGFIGEVYIVNEKKVLVYDFIYRKDDLPNRPQRLYSELFYSLTNCVVPSWYHTKEVNLQSCKGMLFHFDQYTSEYKLLMILAVKSTDIFTIDKLKPDYSKFALFISHDFSEDPLYKAVYNKIEKEYVIQARDLGIDIVYTKHIKERCFSNSLRKPKYTNITEMQKAMKDINKTLLD